MNIGRSVVSGLLLLASCLGLSRNAPQSATDSSGNVYAIHFQYPGNKLLVLRRNPNATIQWYKKIQESTSLVVYGQCLRRDGSGNTYIAYGVYNGTGTRQTVVTKLNSSGGQSWTKRIGTTSTPTTFKDFDVDSSGNCYVSAAGTGSLGYAAYLYKITSGGTVSSPTIRSLSQTFTYSNIKVCPNGQIALSGISTTKPYTQNNDIPSTLYVTRMNSSFGVLSDSTISLAAWGEAGVLTVDANSNIYVGCSALFPGATSSTGAGTVAKVSSTGVLSWTTTVNCLPLGICVPSSTLLGVSGPSRTPGVDTPINILSITPSTGAITLNKNWTGMKGTYVHSMTYEPSLDSYLIAVDYYDYVSVPTLHGLQVMVVGAQDGAGINQWYGYFADLEQLYNQANILMLPNQEFYVTCEGIYNNKRESLIFRDVIGNQSQFPWIWCWFAVIDQLP